MTQIEQILEYLQTHKEGISQKEAADLFGCYRLAARINELRESGYEIDTLKERGIRRDGTVTYYGRYRLHGAT